MIKKKYCRIICFLIVFISVFMVLCTTVLNLLAKNHVEHETIITSFYPIHIATLNLTENIKDIEVINITMGNEGCIHDFIIPTSYMKKIEKSKVIIFNGLGMEGFINKILEFPKILPIDSSKNIEVIKYKKCKSDHKCSCFEDVDPHIWLSIPKHIKQVNNIHDGLIKVYPNHSKEITKNRDKYIKKLDELDKKAHLLLDKKDNKQVIAFFPTFSYLFENYGITVPIKMFNSHVQDLNPKKISKAIEEINKLKLKLNIFVEKNDKHTSLISSITESGKKSIELDPISSGEYSLTAYIDAMENNINILSQSFE